MKGRLKLHRFVKKSNNYCRYGYENLLWLELLLRLLGLNSLREKVNFLKHLEGEGRLAIFYQRSQVHFIKSVSAPSLATFSQYKRHFNTNQCTYDDLFKLLSQEVQQALFLKETMLMSPWTPSPFSIRVLADTRTFKTFTPRWGSNCCFMTRPTMKVDG